MKKEFNVPDEIVDIFEDMRAYYDCRDSAIKNCFFWKRAAYFSKLGNKYRKKAWDAVKEIYPETKGFGLEYNPTTKTVIVVDA